jgi:hypothetical protein
MHPLDGPRLKIRRARSHIESLRAADAAFMANADYRVIVAELNPKTKKYALRALINVLPPLELGVCIGEIAHDLRSALDGLVYQLGVLDGASEEALTRTQFPVFLKQRVLGCRGKCRGKLPHFTCGGLKLIEPLSPEHQAAIKRFQPYRSVNLGKRSPLYFLHELNNADKHRLLQVVGAKPAGYGVGATWGDEPFPDYRILPRTIFEDGAKVGRVAAADVDKRKVQADQRIVPLIAFWQGCGAVQGLGVTPILSQIADRVSEIVESFGPEFGERAESP